MQQQKGMWLAVGGVGALALAVVSAPAQAEVNSLSEAVSEGKVGLDFRYRYEYVDQDGIDRSADASTLRSRINFGTAAWQGVSAFIEVDDVSVIGSERYNNATGLPSADTRYPVVADPDGTEVNQAWLSYGGLADSSLKFGRQRIIYDNARFIGNVGWRQNEQTYDGFSLSNSSLSDTTLNYAYVYNVNRIFGEDSPNGDLDTQAHFVNLAYDGFATARLVGYGYFLDLQDAPAASNKTLGLRLTGAPAFAADLGLSYALEYARQSDYADGGNIGADYWLGELGVKLGGWQLTGGYELLGADDSAFSTPLATGHAFNGWADKFLATPADGLEDRYLRLDGSLAGFKLSARYHDFSADRGSAEYGSEIDLQAARSFGDVTLLAKYASYRADDFATDTDKLWLMAQVAF